MDYYFRPLKNGLLTRIKKDDVNEAFEFDEVLNMVIDNSFMHELY